MLTNTTYMADSITWIQCCYSNLATDLIDCNLETPDTSLEEKDRVEKIKAFASFRLFCYSAVAVGAMITFTATLCLVPFTVTLAVSSIGLGLLGIGFGYDGLVISRNVQGVLQSSHTTWLLFTRAFFSSFIHMFNADTQEQQLASRIRKVTISVSKDTCFRPLWEYVAQKGIENAIEQGRQALLQQN